MHSKKLSVLENFGSENMPEHLRALIFILFAATIIFVLGKRIACPEFIAENNFIRRRNLWFGITLTAFLAHNYWVYMIVSGGMAIYATKYEENKFALYLFLLVALPMNTKRLMFSNMKVFDFDYLTLLSLCILLPTFIKLSRIAPQAPRFGYLFQDKILLAYITIFFLLHFEVNTPLEQVRFGIYLFLGYFLPYYIASRTLNTMKDMRDALMSFAIACMVLAVIGFLEWSRHWLLYKALMRALHVDSGFTYYLGRGAFLRAVGTQGQPIALGYVMAVAFGLYLFFHQSISSKMNWRIGLMLLSSGLLAAMSRGPWVGAAAMVVVFVMTSPRATKNVIKVGALLLIVFAIATSTNIFDKYIEYLPFVGSVDKTNVEFRKRLMTESIDIIMRNPFFGDLNADLEQFRTGEDVVDIVNAYVLIALKSGLVGLGLFLSFFGTICLKLYLSMRRCISKNDEVYNLGRTLLSVLVGIQLIIFTATNILIIPYIYWSIAGIAVSYLRLMAQPIKLEKKHA